jgi:hypothetical protein
MLSYAMRGIQQIREVVFSNKLSCNLIRKCIEIPQSAYSHPLVQQIPEVNQILMVGFKAILKYKLKLILGNLCFNYMSFLFGNPEINIAFIFIELF